MLPMFGASFADEHSSIGQQSNLLFSQTIWQSPVFSIWETWTVFSASLAVVCLETGTMVTMWTQSTAVIFRIASRRKSLFNC